MVDEKKDARVINGDGVYDFKMIVRTPETAPIMVVRSEKEVRTLFQKALQEFSLIPGKIYQTFFLSILDRIARH